MDIFWMYTITWPLPPAFFCYFSCAISHALPQLSEHLEEAISCLGNKGPPRDFGYQVVILISV